MTGRARAYWDQNAGRYDASMRWLLGRPLPRMLELTAEAVRGRHCVLEVGAGTGIVTTAIAGSVGMLVATDYASAMVAVLRQRTRDAGLGNVVCERADLYELPYGSGEFDAIVAANVLHLVPNLPRALDCLRPVLSPDGRFVAPTFCHAETLISRPISRLLLLTGFPGRRKFTAASLQVALSEAGLRITRTESLRGIIPIGYVEGVFA